MNVQPLILLLGVGVLSTIQSFLFYLHISNKKTCIIVPLYFIIRFSFFFIIISNFNQSESGYIGISMAPPSTEYLSNYLLDKISHSSTEIQCIHSSPEIQFIDLPWKAYLEIVRYAIKSCRIQEDAFISKAILYLDDRASELAILKLKPHEYLQKEQEMYRVFVNYFKKYAQKYFTVTLQAQKYFSDPTSSITHLIDFIGCLVTILNPEQNPFLKGNHNFPIIRELKFMVCVIEDISWQRMIHQSVVDLLEEFEAVANEAGSFIYSCIFPTVPVNMCMHVLSYKFHLLDANIKDYCIQLIPIFRTTPVNSRNSIDALDSLIVDLESLLALLRELMDSRIESLDDMNDHMKKLHGEVTSAQTFLKDTNRSQHKEIEGLKECVVLIRDVADEAYEFLIQPFAAENIPVWYMTLRLPIVITKFQIIGKLFKEINKVIHLHVPKDCDPKESLQAKKHSS